MVAVLGETTGHQALIKLRDRMKNDSEGCTILVYVSFVYFDYFLKCLWHIIIIHNGHQIFLIIHTTLIQYLYVQILSLESVQGSAYLH